MAGRCRNAHRASALAPPGSVGASTDTPHRQPLVRVRSGGAREGRWHRLRGYVVATFLQGAEQLEASLMNYSGTIIRFRTSQLPTLPLSDVDCEVVLPDGRTVEGRFKRNEANPYIGGAEIRRWIRSWVPAESSRKVDVLQVGAGRKIELHIAKAAAASKKMPADAAKIRNRAKVLAGIQSAPKRRKSYEAWERNPRLRKVALAVWAANCQVKGCDVLKSLPASARPKLVDVHHLNHISIGGSDSPLNICLLCVAHHALIHRGGPSTLDECDAAVAVVSVAGRKLQIERDATQLW